MRRNAGQGYRLGTIARCGFPRSRLPGVRDRLEAPDPLEDLPEEILRQRDLSHTECKTVAFRFLSEQRSITT